MAESFRCAICSREVEAGSDGNRFRPFCSQRCRTIDLGGWLEGGYRISSAAEDADDLPDDVSEPDKDGA